MQNYVQNQCRPTSSSRDHCGRDQWSLPAKEYKYTFSLCSSVPSALCFGVTMCAGRYPNESVGAQLLNERLSRAQTEHGRSYGINFKPRSDDVLVATAPKCGTTWMQQILHQLRSGGDMSFEDICDVVPYIELAYDVEIDLDAEHEFQPR